MLAVSKRSSPCSARGETAVLPRWPWTFSGRYVDQVSVGERQLEAFLQLKQLGLPMRGDTTSDTTVVTQ